MLTTVVILGVPSPAGAGIGKELAVFATCPVNTPGVTACIVSRTTSGEFKIGSKTVAINKPVTLQGGVSELTTELVPPTDGNTLSKTPLTVQGGLTGIEGLGGEVSATAEVAAPVKLELENLGTNSPAVTLPVKVKLDNLFLGPQCYIASGAEPAVLKLTSGTTNPPPPNKPIAGSKGSTVFLDHNKIIEVTGSSLVDNTFAAPGVNGCGGLLAFLVDPVVDLSAGLPAPAGHNTAILSGGFVAASSRTVLAERALPEVGRCVKVAGVREEGVLEFHGAFENATCVEENLANAGRYEWIPGPGAHAKFSGTSGATTLQTVGHPGIKCTSGAYAGEYTAAKAARETVTLSGCKQTLTSEPCHSASAAAGEIASSALEGELGFIQDFFQGTTRTVSVGLDLKHSPALVTAECGSAREPVVVEGSVIAPFGSIDKMSATNTLKYAASSGRQLPEAFEEAANDTLLAHFGGSSEQAGLTATEKVSGEEKLEIKGASDQ
jgi:hypothetical protein